MGRRLATFVWFAVTALGLAAGLAVDLPQAITVWSTSLPRWLRNPDVWWVAFFVVFYGVILFLLWRPRPGAGELAPSQMFHGWWLGSVESALRTREKDREQAFAMLLLDAVPAALQSFFSKRERTEYESAIESVRSGSLLALFKVASAHLSGLHAKQTWSELQAIEAQIVEIQERIDQPSIDHG